MDLHDHSGNNFVSVVEKITRTRTNPVTLNGAENAKERN